MSTSNPPSASSSASANNDQPIAQLLSSWTNLDTLTDVLDLGRLVGDGLLTQWTLLDIKARFEPSHSDSTKAPIICPRLHSDSIAKFAVKVIEARNNTPEFIRRYQAEPSFIARYVLAQSGAIQPDEVLETDMWGTVEEGELLVSCNGKVHSARKILSI